MGEVRTLTEAADQRGHTAAAAAAVIAGLRQQAAGQIVAEIAAESGGAVEVQQGAALGKAEGQQAQALGREAEEEEWISKGKALLERVKECLEQYGQAWIGARAKKGKMSCVPELILAEIESWNVPLLVEADGARMLPLKVPGEQEPVLLPQTTYVFSVYGMDALDQKLEEICFRSEKAAELLGKQPEDQVTEEDLIKLACHEQGGRKGCPKQAEYIVVLNKADTKERRDKALAASA